MSVLLSIIIPVYRTEAFLRSCLESVCGQLSAEQEDVEVWIVDDGSPDNSIEIIREFERRNPRSIRVLRKANGGLSDARNAALDRCSGEFVWFVDSDDRIQPACLQEILEILRKTPADYVFFEAARVDHADREIGRFSIAMPDGACRRYDFAANELLRFSAYQMVWMRIFRRSFIGGVRFPKGITHEDIHFDIRLLARQPLIATYKRCWYRHFFDNPLSITNTMTAEKHRQVLWVYSDLVDRVRLEAAQPGAAAEYLKYALVKVLRRAMEMPAAALSPDDRFSVFAEQCHLIGSIRDQLVTAGDPWMSLRRADAFVVQLMCRGRPRVAYLAVSVLGWLRDVYDEIGRRTHDWRRSVRLGLWCS